MKTSSDGKPVKRSAAMNCLLVNQFATPGLGSLMGKRYLEGTFQLALAVIGFLLVSWAFLQWILNMYRNLGGDGQAGPFPPIGKIGAIMFITSWLLSWITSVSLVRNSQNTTPPDLESKLPPKIKRD